MTTKFIIVIALLRFCDAAHQVVGKRRTIARLHPQESASTESIDERKKQNQLQSQGSIFLEHSQGLVTRWQRIKSFTAGYSDSPTPSASSRLVLSYTNGFAQSTETSRSQSLPAGKISANTPHTRLLSRKWISQRMLDTNIKATLGTFKAISSPLPTLGLSPSFQPSSSSKSKAKPTSLKTPSLLLTSTPPKTKEPMLPSNSNAPLSLDPSHATRHTTSDFPTSSLTYFPSTIMFHFPPPFIPMNSFPHRSSLEPSDFPSLSPSIVPSSNLAFAQTGKPIDPTFITRPSLRTRQPILAKNPSMTFPSQSSTSIPSDLPSLSPTLLPSGHTSIRTTADVKTSFLPSNNLSHYLGNLSRVPTKSKQLVEGSTLSSMPSDTPSILPSIGPSFILKSEVSSDLPSFAPTLLSLTSPSQLPSKKPSFHPSFSPIPSVQPTTLPSVSPSSLPSRKPTSPPSHKPTFLPSLLPSDTPSVTPSSFPTSLPSNVPTHTPSSMPSQPPTFTPSNKPTSLPSLSPSDAPSLDPSLAQSSFPSSAPSHSPTSAPSQLPTSKPSKWPTLLPSVSPTDLPTLTPTSEPSAFPSILPSSIPSFVPSQSPTTRPSRLPTLLPSAVPSEKPSQTPSTLPRSPSRNPSFSSSHLPSLHPSWTPSNSASPSFPPSSNPSVFPSFHPTNGARNITATGQFNISGVSNTMNPGNVSIFEEIAKLFLVQTSGDSVDISSVAVVGQYILQSRRRRRLQVTNHTLEVLYRVDALLSAGGSLNESFSETIAKTFTARALEFQQSLSSASSFFPPPSKAAVDSVSVQPSNSNNSINNTRIYVPVAASVLLLIALLLVGDRLKGRWSRAAVRGPRQRATPRIFDSEDREISLGSIDDLARSFSPTSDVRETNNLASAGLSLSESNDGGGSVTSVQEELEMNIGQTSPAAVLSSRPRNEPPTVEFSDRQLPLLPSTTVEKSEMIDQANDRDYCLSEPIDGHILTNVLCGTDAPSVQAEGTIQGDPLFRFSGHFGTCFSPNTMEQGCTDDNESHFYDSESNGRTTLFHESSAAGSVSFETPGSSTAGSTENTLPPDESEIANIWMSFSAIPEADAIDVDAVNAVNAADAESSTANSKENHGSVEPSLVTELKPFSSLWMSLAATHAETVVRPVDPDPDILDILDKAAKIKSADLPTRIVESEQLTVRKLPDDNKNVLFSFSKAVRSRSLDETEMSSLMGYDIIEESFPRFRIFPHFSSEETYTDESSAATGTTDPKLAGSTLSTLPSGENDRFPIDAYLREKISFDSMGVGVEVSAASPKLDSSNDSPLNEIDETTQAIDRPP